MESFIFSPPFAAAKAGDALFSFRLSNPRKPDSATKAEKKFQKNVGGAKRLSKSAKSAHPHRADGHFYMENYMASGGVEKNATLAAAGPIDLRDFFD